MYDLRYETKWVKNCHTFTGKLILLVNFPSVNITLFRYCPSRGLSECDDNVCSAGYQCIANATKATPTDGITGKSGSKQSQEINVSSDFYSLNFKVECQNGIKNWTKNRLSSGVANFCPIFCYYNYNLIIE